MTQCLSTIPPRPPSSTSLMIDGWILLRRPDTLSSVDFQQALSDLSVAGKLCHRVIDGNVYVRWLQ